MATTYELIASNTLSSSAASVTFSAIPNTFTDLVLKFSARDTYPTAANALEIEINGDASASYSETILTGDGSVAQSSRFTTGTGFTYLYAPNAINGNSSTSNTFSNNEIYIPNYNASANKPIGMHNVTENNSTNSRMQAQANLWLKTASITSIKLSDGNGYNFVSGSSFFLYGIKNS